jgi:hypothetical protein
MTAILKKQLEAVRLTPEYFGRTLSTEALGIKVELLDFAKRHFEPLFAGTKVGVSPQRFMRGLSTAPWYDDRPKTKDGKVFMRELVVVNFMYDKCLMGKARITDENRHLLQTATVVRQEGETAYESKWFSSIDVNPEPANYLHLILYHADQLKLEGIPLKTDAEWGIVSINAEPHIESAPPTPATIHRNRAGVEAGGNGYQHTDEEIIESVEYHSKWANVK